MAAVAILATHGTVPAITVDVSSGALSRLVCHATALVYASATISLGSAPSRYSSIAATSISLPQPESGHDGLPDGTPSTGEAAVDPDYFQILSVICYNTANSRYGRV